MLYIVATPIGNLEDITLRALRILKEADIIACEDTRHTKILLNHFEIKKELISFHEHSKQDKLNELIDLLKKGKDVALVTDAGTPGISDPGGKLVDQVIRELGDEAEVVAIPGASALTAALSISGIYLDEFVFYGFLPHKKGRQTKLKEMSNEKKVMVFYESPHRISKLMDEILEFGGDKNVIVFRELTKKFEEVYRGKVSEIKSKIKAKGEFVVIIGHEITTNNLLRTTNKVDLLYKELSYKLQGIAQKIRKDYGSGQKELVYQNSFAEELNLANISFDKEASIPIKSINTEKVIGTYRPDFIIDEKIILELKAVSSLPEFYEKQMYDYLRNSDFELGYIVNFGGNKLYCKRIIYTNDYKDFSKP